ncbi:MAG: EamA family transporter [Chloroflexota bacterium]
MPDVGPFGSASVVVFGLLSAAAWGSADFGGGLTTRRATLYGVVLVSQLTGMALALVLALLRGEAMPAATDAGWAVVAGLLGAVGIAGLYSGLAVGRMGVVAPVTGVLAAVVPVAAGIALEGLPPTIVLVGIVLAIAAVVLVSRVPGEAGGRSGIELALVAGVALGLFNVAISRVDDALVFGPLTIVRGVEALTIGTVVIVSRRRVAVPARLLPAVAGVGVLDMTGNAAFMFAQGMGALAVAAVLSSLYPVATLILAAAVLGERMTRSHAIGIAAAVAGIVLIGAGAAPAT